MKKLITLLFLLQFCPAIGQNYNALYTRMSAAVFYEGAFGIVSVGWERKNDKVVSFLPRAGLLFINNNRTNGNNIWENVFMGVEVGADLKFTGKYISAGMEMLTAYAINLRRFRMYEQDYIGNINFYLGTGRWPKGFGISFYTGVLASNFMSEAGPTFGFRLSYKLGKKESN